MLHAILGSVLFTQPPTSVALTILDVGEITPLYREVPHLIAPPGSARETLELLAGIAARLQARPTTPVHLIIVQEQLRSVGRELYSLLPALVTSGGKGPTTLLPGQGAWPKRGEARLVGRGLRVEGREICLNEAAIAAQLAQLRGRPGMLPPVLWDDRPISFGTPAAARVSNAPGVALIVGEEPHDNVALTSRPEAIEGSHTMADDAAQRRRIASAMTARRQALMDADAAPAAALLTPATAMPRVAGDRDRCRRV